MMGKIFVGIDISKEKLDVSLRPSGDLFQVQNSEGRMIVKMKVAEKNRLNQARGKVRESIESVPRCLEERLREIERVLSEDEEMRGDVELLESMKGVGRKTAVTIAAKLPELGKVSNKEIASLVGVAPFSDDREEEG